jgi:BirA family biotin operon repressor/biotin-[acetyl-CoA-carboxylase] ligase
VPVSAPSLAALQSEAIAADLGEHPVLRVEVVASIDSTNGELGRRASLREIHGLALAAERQTAGRGRQGRRWESIEGGSLTFSLGWRFARGASGLSGVTLAAGLAVARALESIGYRGVELKWPNDLLHRGAKLGGILVELTGDAKGSSLAIVGVGLNLQLPPELRAALGRPVTDLASLSGNEAIDRNAMLAGILRELAAVLTTFAAQGFAPLREDWEQRHALQRQQVDLQLPDGGTARGVVLGVDADGALMLDGDGGHRRFVSGEASLVRALP